MNESLQDPRNYQKSEATRREHGFVIKIFAFTSEQTGLDTIAAHARRVEAMGFDGLYVPDVAHDGLLLACQALAATQRISVALNVLIAFPRSPMNVAHAAWDLQHMSGGRFELGLGTQIRQNIEDRYSSRWLPPATGMREYVGALRAIFHSFRTREPLNFVGEHYQFTRLQPFFNPGPIDAPDVPVMLGAVGPRMLALVGEVADGMYTHPTNTSSRYLREAVLPQVAAGTARRNPMLQRPPLICATELVATGPDDAVVAAQREHFRATLAFLYSTPAYWRSLELFGWKDIGIRLLQMTREGRWKEMAKALPDEVLDQFLVSGRYDQLPEALASRFGGLVDRITMIVPDDPAHDRAASAALTAIRANWPHPKAS